MALEEWKMGDMTFTWLNGGVTHMDGGAMFGVVPKALWSRRYPFNDKNQIELRTDPILIQVDGKNLLVETGIGNGKFSDKEIRNFGIHQESKVRESLASLHLTVEDIDYILMTHMHFDHLSGATNWDGDKYVSVYPNATYYVQEIEWNELQIPNIRSKSTYFKRNWEAIVDQVVTFKDRFEVIPGIEMIHTGGHSQGHCMLKIERGGKRAFHMADIMPTHAHQNILWVLAYDDYPMDSIAAKQKYLLPAIEEESYFLFYHDYKYRLVQWDKTGKEILTSLVRNRDNE